MTITLRPDQERVLVDAINSGLAGNADEALDQALDGLRLRLPPQAPAATPDESVAAAVRRDLRQAARVVPRRDDRQGIAPREPSVSRLILDASVVPTWCFPHETSQKAAAISERIAAGDRVAVPGFWRHEILNALLVGERRKRLTRDLSEAFLDDLNRLPVDVDEQATSAIVFNVTQALCRKHGLTAYDAAYLELAMRGGHPLATVDDDMHKAAIAENVSLI